MPGPFSGDAQAASSKAFTLEIAGRDYLNPGADTEPFIPVDLNPIVWNDQNGNDVGSMSIVVYDPQPLWANRVPIRAGNEVIFRRAGQTEPIFGGNVTTLVWRSAIVGRYLELSILSFDAWLDWRAVPRLINKKNTSNGKTVRFNKHDDQIIKRMFGADRRSGPLTVRGGFVHRTTHPSRTEDQMPKGFAVSDATLREALEEIAEEANYDGLPRQFYVDYSKRLHYYRLRRDGKNGTNLNAAPFRITNQGYITHLKVCEATLVEAWPLRERPSQATGGVVHFNGINGVGELFANDLADITDGTAPGGVTNEPGYLPVHSDGGEVIEGDAAVDSAVPGSLGDTWTAEYWLNLESLAGSTRLLTSTGAPDTWVEIFIQSDGAIKVAKRSGGGIDYISTDAPLADKLGQWVHLVVAHSPGVTQVIVNGALRTGTTTSKVFGSAGSYQAIHSSGGGLIGDIQFHAIYAGRMTEAEALVHFQMGRAIIPEDHTFTDDSESETHAVYVKGKNAKGSGWVNVGNGGWTHNKQEYITRKGSNTSGKKRKKGRAWLRRQEDHLTGTFTVTDPDHATGWRAGQVVFSDDTSIGLTSTDTYRDGTLRQPYEVVAVAGELSGGNRVRIDIEYGVLKRTLLRRLSKRRGR